MHSSNVAHYDGCEADLWLENESTGFLSRFNAATRNALSSTSIKVKDENTGDITEIARKCFILSYTEYGYGGSTEGPSYLDVFKAWKGTTDGNTARIATNESGTTVSAWLRSPGSASQFRICYYNGNANDYSATSANNWLRPALSFNPSTLVSDSTEETVYLLPDPDKPYREAGITKYMGSLEEVPSCLKVMLPYEDCLEGYPEVDICVNYNDSEPEWVRVTIGETVDTSELTAENGVALGIRIYARSEGRAIIHEPIIVTG
ncbi:MAG: hypothetical protein IJ731_09865 [Eubacterium sp.]|nr:hypothetical protein [Eubacterium sp.]